ncbi:diguanylate cyclase domain-containing protein [Deinococcus cellulosilyticus]|uniref:GGDEF domain-containing protein n=1 Tax=Deinococcus cellulosilyticus (strain DSM 18568 / NBRC 106333 / KACC 11606 / 5516J-15) TaxID=1223518 RepID=A0A511N0R7_DEIC1|nr:diguanylate cyclase [Deinococcus cellulosilyticus]GEM46462.1 hypothetical protein DC3_20970 [Deinococcus cellulosilyticus NBRC 106333 = KACC 11606]
MMDDSQPMNSAPQGALIRDPDSGAYSRELFAPRLAEEAARATRELSALTLCLLEVRAEGGLSGDQVREVLALVRQTLRVSDVIFRFSDAEFLLMLPATIKSDGQMTCERLLQNLRGQLPAEVSLHVGLATHPEDLLDHEKLLDLLYARKDAAVQAGPDTCVSTGS